MLPATEPAVAGEAVVTGGAVPPPPHAEMAARRGRRPARRLRRLCDLLSISFSNVRFWFVGPAG
jgi:hypothetical protein